MTKRKQPRVKILASLTCLLFFLLLVCMLGACQGSAPQKFKKAAEGQEVYYQCFDSALMIYDPQANITIGKLDTGEGPLYDMPGLNSTILTHNVENAKDGGEESYGEILLLENNEIKKVAEFSEREVFPLAYDVSKKNGYYLACKDKNYRELVRVNHKGDKVVLVKDVGNVMSGVFLRGNLYMTRYVPDEDEYELLMWKPGLTEPVNTGIRAGSDELYALHGKLLLSDEETIYSGDGSIRIKKCDYNYISDEMSVILQIQANKDGKTTATICSENDEKKEYRHMTGYSIQKDSVRVYGTENGEEYKIQ